MTNEALTYPLDQAIDLGHTAVKVAVGCLPGGNALSEVFNTFVPSQLSQRRDEWGARITELVNGLLAEGNVTAAALQNDPAFVDMLVEATICAIKTSNELKRTAFLHAIASSAKKVVEPDRQHMYVRLLDELTEMHLQLLKAYSLGRFSAAIGTGEEYENRFFALVSSEFPSLKGERDLIIHLCSDLANRSLIALPPKGPRSMGGLNIQAMRITQSGTGFLKFCGL